MNYGEMPMLRVELEHHKQTLIAAINDRLADQEHILKDAVERALTPEYVRATVEKQAREVFDRVLVDEIQNYYRYGNGRAAIRAAIEERLNFLFPEGEE
jgi:hypothetical protein